MKIFFLSLCLVSCLKQVYMGRLQVHGSHIMKDGKRVFLSGANLAWIAFGYDFGDNNYQYRKAKYESYLKQLHDNGGNSLRVWVHIEGTVSPHFDVSGYVTGLDKAGTFLTEFKEFLDKAHSYNIYVFPCLWNGALKQHHTHLGGLIKDTSKLQSYIDKALIPWVKLHGHHPALGGWDIMNEIEGVILVGQHNKDPCFDTVFLRGTGAGWAGQTHSAQELLRFINWQADAIRRTDPHALVTAGPFNARTETDRLNTHNFYSDHCLQQAGGKHQGILTFYSPHMYDWQGKYDQWSPFKNTANTYGLHKPIVIAEFNSFKGAGMDIEDQFKYAYNHGYAGAWSWQLNSEGSNAESTANQLRGIKAVSQYHDQSKGGLVALKQ